MRQINLSSFQTLLTKDKGLDRQTKTIEKQLIGTDKKIDQAAQGLVTAVEKADSEETEEVLTELSNQLRVEAARLKKLQALIKAKLAVNVQQVKNVAKVGREVNNGQR